MDCSIPSFLILYHLLEFAQTQVHWVGDAIQASHSLSHHFTSAFNLSQHQDLISNESALCIRWPEHWSFSLSIRVGLFPNESGLISNEHSNEYPELISFTIDWFDKKKYSVGKLDCGFCVSRWFAYIFTLKLSRCMCPILLSEDTEVAPGQVTKWRCRASCIFCSVPFVKSHKQSVILKTHCF